MPPTATPANELAAALKDAIVSAQVETQQRLKPIENTNPPRASWNGYGAPDTPTLTRKTFLSHIEQREKQLTADEIRGFNALVPGRYNGDRWVVEVVDAGLPTEAVNLKVPLASLDQRMGLPPLTEILRQINDEAASRPKARAH